MKYAYDVTYAFRRILGTDHPVNVVVYKSLGQNPWTCAVICNGLAEYTRNYRTQRQAMDEARALIAERAGEYDESNVSAALTLDAEDWRS